MQYIRYCPSGQRTGIFYFPTVALIKYLEHLVDGHGMADHKASLKDMLILTRNYCEFIDLEVGAHSLDFYAADMVDRGVFTVMCPVCVHHYTASHIVCEHWSAMQRGGRRYFCPLQHELLKVQDWIT